MTTVTPAYAVLPFSDLDDLKQQIARINWFHRIDLGHGIITPGPDDSPVKLRGLRLPDDLIGRSVLDVGAWDGFFSFEAERRGARRVLATDTLAWHPHGPYRQEGFNLARRALGSRVEDQLIDVMDLSPQAVGVFDLVLFLGLFYHLRHPLLALERIFSVTGDQLILETHLDLLDCKRPAMVFYPTTELNHDPSNWWGPNPAAVEWMLRDVGFRKVKQFQTPYCGFARRVFHAWR